MTHTFHLESSQSDRISWDEMTRAEARALFAMEDMESDRGRSGAAVAALSWPNTEILIEQDTLVVDDVAEARARYLDAFAQAWDEERAEREEATVALHEDNAGRLYLLQGGAAYGYDVTPLVDEGPGTFEQHAVALLEGATDDWTLEQVAAADLGGIPIAATYDGQQGRVYVMRQERSGEPLAGSAARLFIGPLEYADAGR